MRIREVVELARALHDAQPDPDFAVGHSVWLGTVRRVADSVVPETLRARFVKSCEDGAMMRLVSKRASS